MMPIAMPFFRLKARFLEKTERCWFPSSFHLTVVGWTLQISLLILQIPPAFAGQDIENSESEDPDPCRSVAILDAGHEGLESNPSAEPCSPPDGAAPDVARREIVSEIAEGTHTSESLESLLLGRDYVFFGRVEVDAAAYSGDIPSSENGAQLRRLRVGMAGLTTFFDDLSYKIELDLTDGTNNFSDVYLQWDTPRGGLFRLGNQRISQNLSAMTSSLSQLFMEDPLPVSAFSLKRRLALSYDQNWRRFGLHGMVFSRDPNNNAGEYGWALRAFSEPIRGPRKLGHFGVFFVTEKMDDEARYRTRPESRVTGTRLVDTGLYSDVRYQHVAGIELAGGVGANSARFEWFRSRWDRAGGRKNNFEGAYLELGHFLTGQAFNYRGGKFVRPMIESGERAWEVGLRASWVNLTDRDVQGGEQVNLGAALNYYFLPGLRFQLNLLHFRTDGTAGKDAGWIMQSRIQYNR